jgi:hypothetical protein
MKAAETTLCIYAAVLPGPLLEALAALKPTPSHPAGEQSPVQNPFAPDLSEGRDLKPKQALELEPISASPIWCVSDIGNTRALACQISFTHSCLRGSQ